MSAAQEVAERVSSDLNPLVREGFLNPYPMYQELRALGPVVWMQSLNAWGVFRDAEVRRVITDWQSFGSKGGGGVSNFYFEKPWREPSVVFEVDPPDHTRTRTVLTRVLSPAALAKLKAGMEAEAARLVNSLLERKTFDAVADFARPFPLKVLPDAVGLPEEGRHNLLTYNQFVRKGRALNWRQNWTEADEVEGERITNWVADHCRREGLKADGFGAQIYAAADAGEISDYEAAMLVRSFLTAGVEGTINGISHTINLLMAHPEQWAIVRDDPTKVRAAFEEMLRFDSGVQIIARNTMGEMDFEGVRLGAFDKVIAFIGSANRDPSRWANPDVYDVTRNTAGHVALGTGIHGCVGQMIARMEATAVLGALVRAVDEIRPAGAPVYRTTGARGLESLPVTIRGRQGSLAQ
ncbi:MAG: cytochrome P450 [Phreatobacter sp.]|uniref:cytochrome P450 n=1 Tax=Phreatobacter sp. TaxID=1966341 RepID=UPI00273518B0|nr:cytochrome P450 [Phreatobacter sp.]MDP2801853.1 cytochrome P450 [Phreatobacter sp.]